MTAAAALPNVVDAVICFGKEAMQPRARPGSGGRPSVATSGLRHQSHVRSGTRTCNPQRWLRSNSTSDKRLCKAIIKMSISCNKQDYCRVFRLRQVGLLSALFIEMPRQWTTCYARVENRCISAGKSEEISANKHGMQHASAIHQPCQTPG